MHKIKNISKAFNIKGYSKLTRKDIFMYTFVYATNLYFHLQPYHNNPFGSFWYTKFKKMNPKILEFKIKMFNHVIKNEDPNMVFEINDFLKNVGEVFKYIRPKLFEKENLYPDFITERCQQKLENFYENSSLNFENYELLDIKDIKIDNVAVLENVKTEDKEIYVRVKFKVKEKISWKDNRLEMIINSSRFKIPEEIFEVYNNIYFDRYWIFYRKNSGPWLIEDFHGKIGFVPLMKKFFEIFKHLYNKN
jgi:hypothetical protein